ncbi:MAG: extracellular solute-binding protein [Ktedonobacteraceae bacterium]|nr:extracellular solute-binding protein [Ktedonobacteraceae bacterium]
MSNLYSRRRVIEMGLGSFAGLSILGLAACGGSGGGTTSSTGNITLQLFFWGAASRDKLTRQAIDLYQQKYANVKISSQFTDFTQYWNKLNTQIAGNAAPDLIQMDMRYIAQFVQKKLLLDLTPYISDKTIDLADFDQGLLKSSEVNNTPYGIPMGGNYQGLFYDTEMIKQANVGEPQDGMTWDQFADYTTKVAKALGSGMYGVTDLSGDITSFEVWTRQHNKELYTTDGKLGFTEQDVIDWFTYWDKLRKAGGAIPTDVQAGFGTSGNPDATGLVHGKAAFHLTYSNLIDAFQKSVKHKLAIVSVPTGSTPGMYLKPSMLMSISAKTKHPKESANFIGFINNDPGAVKALSVERGTPGSAKARQLLVPTLTATQQVMMDYFERVGKSNFTRPKLVLDPAGAGEVEKALLRNAQNVGFGKVSIADGAKAFYADAQKAIGA